MISLLTFPDVTYTGFKIATINVTAEMQSQLATNLADCETNVAIFDLNLESTSVEYILAAIETSDIVLIQSPNMFHWLTGYVIAKPNCYYIEFDSANLNTLYKVSLRQIDDANISTVVKNAIQKKYNKAL